MRAEPRTFFFSQHGGIYPDNLWVLTPPERPTLTLQPPPKKILWLSTIKLGNEDLVNHYVPSRSLRSTSQGLLTVPRSTTSTYGDRAFSIAAPRLWNTLPLMIRNAQSVSAFKRLLKTSF